MRLRPFLKKEIAWSKRNVLGIIILLIVVPLFVAGASVGFQTIIPTDMPVGVVGATDTVTQDDLTVVEGTITFFSDPVRYESRSQAFDGLRREQVYALIEVPPGIADRSNQNLEFMIYVDGSIVPFRETSKVIANIANAQLSSRLPMDVRVTRTVLEPTHTLPEYLIPLLLFGIVALFSFGLVPYNLASERPALDRIRAESSLEALVVSKLAFFTALLTVPVGVFWAACEYLDYQIAVLAPGAILTIVISFLLMSIFSMAVMFLTRFSTTGRFLNVLVLFGLFSFGGLIYPVGFFSSLRRMIARLVPVHYTMIALRSAMLKDTSIALFETWIVRLLALVVVAGFGLKLSIHVYRWRAQ